MKEDVLIKIEDIVFTPDFYLQNYRDDQAAADFLEVSLVDWTAFLKLYEESLSTFIYSMRREDVLVHLQRNPKASLRDLAAQNGFRSRLHLLWHFYKRHYCTPRRWAVKVGLIPD